MLLKNDSRHRCPKVRLKARSKPFPLASAFSPRARHPQTGGADRDRTDDPLLAKQVLSQLSYSPDSEVRLQMSETADPAVVLTSDI
jgi:hypothetical protein